MYDFNGSWTDEIADITNLPEFQNALVKILDPTVEKVYDFDLGEYVYPGGEVPTLYEGRARVKDYRWGVFLGGEAQANSNIVTAFLIQLPKATPGVFPRRSPVHVLECEDNPHIVGKQYAINSDAMGSTMASRTFEASLDGDSVGS